MSQEPEPETRELDGETYEKDDYSEPEYYPPGSEGDSDA